MKKLILVRHGAYSGRNLSPLGQAQIRAVAASVGQRINGSSVVVLTSTVPRAVEAGRILAEAFGAPLESHDILFSSPTKDEFGLAQKVLSETDALIQSQNADVVLVATHGPHVDSFPYYFASRNWGGVPFERRRADCGDAIILDLEKREGHWLP